MDNCINLDEPPIFRSEEWIGKKKIYSWKDLPLFAMISSFWLTYDECSDCNAGFQVFQCMHRQLFQPITSATITFSTIQYYESLIY